MTHPPAHAARPSARKTAWQHVWPEGYVWQSETESGSLSHLTTYAQMWMSGERESSWLLGRGFVVVGVVVVPS